LLNTKLGSNSTKITSICSDDTHPTDACPTLQEANSNNHTIAAAKAFLGRPQQQYNP